MPSNQNSGRLLTPEPADPNWLMRATHEMYMTQVKRDEPEWFAEYEDLSELSSSEAMKLAATAPSEYCAGLLIGRGLALASLEALAERADFPFVKQAASAASQ